MPLLNRKAFRTDPPPSDLKENEEIFVCRQTNEVYRDYESFFKKTILCNSLVWSCEVTLKHSLTYEEALDCEREARKVAARIAVPIQQGVLTLVHYTRHSRLDNLCDEVYNYIRNRYQEGEEVEVKYKGEKLFGYIHNVIEPTSLTNGFDSKLSSPTSKEPGSKKLSSPHGKNKSGKNSNLASPSKSNSEVIVLSDGESNNKNENSTLPSPLSSKSTSKWPDAKYYQYEVKLKNIKNNTKIPEFVTVKQANVSRKKGAFTREKLKLLLRVTCHRSAPTPEHGFWVVNDEYQKKFDLSPDVNISLEAIPDKRKSKKRKSDGTLNDKSSWKKRKLTNEEKNKKKSGDIKKKDKGKKDDNKLKQMKGLKKMSAEEIQRVKLEMQVQREKEREIRKKERDVEKELKKNERNKARQEKMELLREQKLFLLHWCVPQDDLDLDDHKELPTPVPVQSKFSGEMLGNIIMALEFLHIFGEFFDMKQDFPDGVTLGMLEEALTEHDAEGLFYDIMKFLLQCILKTHAEEEEEEGLDDSDVQAHDEAENEKENDVTEESDFTRVKKAVSASASMAAVWSQLYQGRNLHELTLDPFTCSEMLRLHFLSSGARLVSGPDGDTYRWQRRGGFTFADDAGVAFRHREHDIMRALVTNNIYDLDAVDKLKILSTLCTQLLTYATTRDIIDDGFERWRKAKRDWQEEQWADQRKDKEEAAAKYRKKQEERAKEREEKEEKEKKLKENNSENPEEAKKEITKQDSSQQDSQPTSTEDVPDEQNSPKAMTRSQGPIAEEPLICDDQNNEEFEREERKGRLKKKEKAFAKEIRKGQALSGIQPIGADRVFRRYWLFNSINGLFIEDNDPELCKLLQPEDPEDESSDEGSAEESTSETHETGEPSTTPEAIVTSLNPQEMAVKKQPSTCSLTKQQIHDEKELFRILKLYGIPLESLPENSPLTRGELGEKRVENCEKFDTRNIVQWSYFDKKDDFDKLLSTLNPRGFREKYLREGLLQHYDTIVNGLEDNPLRLENREQSEVLKQLNSKRGGFRNQPQGVDKSLYKTMEDFIEANLRDNILDLEDRIWQGGLGSVKIEEITAWRKQVENGIYDFLPAAGTETDKDGGQVSMNGDINGSNVEKMDVDEDKDPESAEHEDSVDIKSNKPSFLPCLEDSRPGTPVDGSFAATPTTVHTPQAINPCVRSLAKAVMQVEQGIERKYLIPPLGDDEETKKRKQQEAADAARTEFEEMMTAAGKKKKDKNMKNGVAAESEKQENSPDSQVSQKTETVAKQQKTLLERWEDSLMASTNLSQVYIHLTNLDNCISWDKSVLNARCRICRRKGDAEHMLLCDGCDRGHHMYCLKPPIKEVPEGDWYCSSCRPKEPRRSFRKNRGKEEENDEEPREEYKTKMKEEEMEESDESDDDEKEEDEDSSSDEDSDDDDDDEDSDDDDDDDDEDEENESEEAIEESDEEGSVHMETCACCDGGGELLCCEMCPLAFHLECAYPPLRRVPRGDWVCQVCTGADYELPAGRRVKKTVIKAATKRANGSDISPKPTKRAKTSTKTTDIKADTKKPASEKRQTVQSSSAALSPPPPAVRVSSRKPSTSSNLTTVSKAQSNPAPKKTTGQKKTSEKQTTSSKVPTDSKAQSNPAPKKTTNAKLPGQKKTSEKQATSSNISTTPKTPSNPAPKKATSAKLLAQKKTTEQPATSPNISTAPKGLSNSAPKKTTNAKWSGQKKGCEKLLKEMRDHEDSWPFLYPVNEIDVPDYFTIITTPMDFKTIETKLSSRQYHSAQEFAADVRQIFFNCSEYNKPRTREARSGVRMSALFETRFGELGLDGTENRSVRTRRSK